MSWSRYNLPTMGYLTFDAHMKRDKFQMGTFFTTVVFKLLSVSFPEMNALCARLIPPLRVESYRVRIQSKSCEQVRNVRVRTRVCTLAQDTITTKRKLQSLFAHFVFSLFRKHVFKDGSNWINYLPPISKAVINLFSKDESIPE